MTKIGLTGSIASGKTTASKIISSRRGPLFSADQVVKKLYTQNSFKKLIAKKLNLQEPVAYVTQTTLSVDDTKDIIELLEKKYKNLKSPVKEDICYATTNRQSAVKQIAPQCEMFFVIGSENSSNSKRLVEVAKKAGCKKSYLFDSNNQLPFKEIVKCNRIGLTSGASAPEKLVQDFIYGIKKYANVSIEEFVSTKESVTFKLPVQLS